MKKFEKTIYRFVLILNPTIPSSSAKVFWQNYSKNLPNFMAFRQHQRHLRGTILRNLYTITFKFKLHILMYQKSSFCIFYILYVVILLIDHLPYRTNFFQVTHKLTQFLFFFRIERFSQNFIDIREKERKRGARGLVTVPTKTELLGNETSADNSTVTTLSPEEQAKADDMLKLQQKITQELLNSNLKENERNELQVRIKTFFLSNRSQISATNCGLCSSFSK